MFPFGAPRSRRHLFVAAAFALMTAATFVVGHAQDGNGSVSADVGPASDNDPTFYADVLPILQENCQACHRSGGLDLGGMTAPMALTSYEEARPWAPMIADAVAEGRMPPWHAHPQHQGQFQNERYLAPEDRETLIAWAEGGAPAGDPADAPSQVSFAELETNEDGWSIGQPDLVLTFDEPYLVEDHVEDEYANIPVHVSEEDVPEPMWIKKSELFAGSHAVHHIISDVGSLVPGIEPTVYRDGFARLLQPGPRNILFQMHYHKQPGPGTAVYDQSRAGVIFYEPGEVIEHMVTNAPMGMFTFVIPAGDPDYSMSTREVFEEDTYILNFTPHMHLRGKAARYELTYPDGESEVLLYVPNYDFNWQHTYELKEPVLAPAGSVLELTLWWDNSENNPHNPDPTVDVRWGQPTTDEMGFGFVGIASAEPLNLVVGEPIPQEVLDAAGSGSILDAIDPTFLLNLGGDRPQ